MSDWGGPEHTEPLAYARRLSLNLVCELTRRRRPSPTVNVPNAHAKCARRISNGANCDRYARCELVMASRGIVPVLYQVYNTIIIPNGAMGTISLTDGGRTLGNHPLRCVFVEMVHTHGVCATHPNLPCLPPTG